MANTIRNAVVVLILCGMAVSAVCQDTMIARCMQKGDTVYQKYVMVRDKYGRYVPMAVQNCYFILDGRTAIINGRKLKFVKYVSRRRKDTVGVR